ncbi:hypothetical protein SAMN04487989_1011005 [Bizionia echini]|uniref:Uncharacterized protein n=1 Tax=Bizionia echini TaxID=649333 RepID=A0A1I4ZQL5_9FLAO|nr:hypothetical protein SAMN04487989_1011005 [Bizionia echini]
MNLETFIYGYIPILIGLLGILVSIGFTRKNLNILNFISSIVISISNSLAIYMLISILAGAYPTFMPHALILISTILVLIQYLIKRRKLIG